MSCTVKLEIACYTDDFAVMTLRKTPVPFARIRKRAMLRSIWTSISVLLEITIHDAAGFSNHRGGNVMRRANIADPVLHSLTWWDAQ